MNLHSFWQSIKKSKSKSVLLFLLILSTCICIRFDFLIKNIGTEKVIEAWGDGLKTYTNTIYHIDHDAKYNWFEGMNYPYGEHIIPATELPGIAILMRALKPIFPNISTAVVSVIHIELLIALLLGGLFLFLIFRELKLPLWYNIIISIGILFLAPQNLRMTSHFGLAQPFIIPLILYLLLLFEKKPSYTISLWIGVSVFLTSFLHFYFFGILVFLISFYFFFRLFNQPKKEENTAVLPANSLSKITASPPFQYAIRMIPHYFLMVVVTFLFYYFWMMSRDPVIDRSPNPYGFLVYLTNWEGVFLWKGNPIFGWINENIIRFRATTFEGKVYIGLIAGTFFISILFRVILRLVKKSFRPSSWSSNSFLNASFGAAMVLLILSLGLPFIISPFEFLIDYVGPLRQFRSIGRFAWVFYFVINIIAFYSLFHFFKSKSKTPQIIGITLLLSVLIFESFSFSYKNKLSLSKVPYWTKGDSFTSIDSIEFNKYQASLPIPYFNVASNNFDESPEGFQTQRSYVLANQTGLPTTGAMLTRNSLLQTFNQWQLILEPYREPAIFKDFKNDKPLLLIWFNNPKEDYHPQFGHLKDGAIPIYKEGEMELFETELSDFSNRIAAQKNEIQQSIKDNSLFGINDFLSTDSSLNFIYQNFDNQPSEKTYLSSGAYAGQLNAWNQLFFDTIPNQQADSLYHFQIWAWVYEDKMPGTLFTLQEEEETGHILQQQRFHIWPNVRTLDPEGWALVNYEFHLKAKNSRIRITFSGKPRDERTQYFDELLIKPVGTHLYQEKENYWWKDNLWMEK